VIDPRTIAYVLGQFLLALAGTMLIPLLYGALTDGRDLDAMAGGALVTGVVGGLLYWLIPRPTRELSQREGLLMVVSLWSAVGVFGCLPFYFSP
jgi:trk system potassium uptake protein TrkH